MKEKEKKVEKWRRRNKSTVVSCSILFLFYGSSLYIYKNLPTVIEMKKKLLLLYYDIYFICGDETLGEVGICKMYVVFYKFSVDKIISRCEGLALK